MDNKKPSKGIDEDDILMQKVFEKRVKGRTRSRRHSPQLSRGSAASPPRGRSGIRSGSNSSQERVRRERGSRGQSGGSGGGIQVFPPRKPSTLRHSQDRRTSPERVRLASAESDHPKRTSSGFELKRVPSPLIVVTPAPAEPQESPKLSVAPKFSQDHLKLPMKKRKKRKKRTGSKASSDEDTKPIRSKRGQTQFHPQSYLAAALREERQGQEGQIGKQVQIRLTKSHALVRAKQRHRKEHPETWTKEEIDWEWKELLWRMNLIGRVYMGCADMEYRIVRMSYKYHNLMMPSLVIFLMFFLPGAMYWDYRALNSYEVPQFTFMRHTGCITFVHFLAVMMNTYTYMMASLQNTRRRMRFILGIGMIVHPILFFIRCYFDQLHATFTAEYTVYYDAYVKKSDAEPQANEMDRSHEKQKFQPWDQFMADRGDYNPQE